jgi:uncharacterized protein YneR
MAYYALEVIDLKIVITNEALQWFTNEMEAGTGDYIRFYARYGGSSPFHEGFSLGMNREAFHEIGVETVHNHIHFYIEQSDLWFFNDHDLIVSVNEKLDELQYDYQQNS